jgi:CheY-like chemotaxis protein
MQANGTTVLVVDDDPAVREISSAWLEREGCRVLTAENGADALNTFEKNRVDLIITDWNMPVMDGISLIRKIRSSTSVMPKVIVVTGMPGGLEDHNLEADATLHKPFECEDLLSEARRLLDKGRRENAAA